jgi:hypothetical protein
MKKKIIERLKWYYPTERNFAFAFSALLIYLAIGYPIRSSLFLLYGLFTMIVVLFQGQHYWLLKLRKLEGIYFGEPAHLALFRSCQWINWLLIALIPVAFYLQLYLNDESQSQDIYIGWALAANGFAVLEHINYYYYQLMIDTKSDWQYLIRYKRLKVSSLRKDLEEGQF